MGLVSSRVCVKCAPNIIYKNSFQINGKYSKRRFACLRRVLRNYDLRRRFSYLFVQKRSRRINKGQRCTRWIRVMRVSNLSNALIRGRQITNRTREYVDVHCSSLSNRKYICSGLAIVTPMCKRVLLLSNTRITRSYALVLTRYFNI